ncbi:metal-dependent transcriptional regulator [Pyrinomonas methylaliphatogenes]|uniref:Transcriptional regulator MntR n=1 Tax=Pyrinomonas methylaliphatogenes TaxID=454194 RepID=A0A0B6X175_9BACT|nr:metal-dependent transcriptional regulator [Pyrinomonas methylaliphatogenes]MBX5479624.1 metal-dependent transcriptional regulator [Pyrinomonas methylaliphatogenes]CDM66747.1 iron (metal) dependent repressor, DtxR family [Pyrinomonas methylaliphatogenes]
MAKAVARKQLPAGITPVIEDYLKTIYFMAQEQAQVKTTDVAKRLRVKPSSVTAMLKTLADLKLVEYRPYYGVALTPLGNQIALEVIRHHRLIELYLVKALGFSWDEVHEEAEVLEHVLSEKLEARIAAHLGDPTLDPHGDPIPALDGTLPETATMTLADAPLRKRLRVVRVRDQDAERLRYIATLGLVPGAHLRLIERAPFEGPVTVRIGKRVHALDSRLARTILVEEAPRHPS